MEHASLPSIGGLKALDDILRGSPLLCAWRSLLLLKCAILLLQAIMESQNNPLAIMNYQDDPDVMLVRVIAFPHCLSGHFGDSAS